jgi:hypothetical protein
VDHDDGLLVRLEIVVRDPIAVDLDGFAAELEAPTGLSERHDERETRRRPHLQTVFGLYRSSLPCASVSNTASRKHEPSMRGTKSHDQHAN